MSDNLLLNCPHCGCDVHDDIDITAPFGLNDERRAVVCEGCGAVTIYPSIDRLFVYWNMRNKAEATKALEIAAMYEAYEQIA